MYAAQNVSKYSWLGYKLHLWSFCIIKLVSPFRHAGNQHWNLAVKNSTRLEWLHVKYPVSLSDLLVGFNPVFKNFNFELSAYKPPCTREYVCSTSREKRTSKHGISIIISSQYWLMEKRCTFGSSVWGYRLWRCKAAFIQHGIMLDNFDQWRPKYVG